MQFDQSTILKMLDWIYEKAINGAPGLGTAEELAENYLNGTGSLSNKVTSLVRWQMTKAATSGFVTGLGGLLILPVTLPINMTSVIFVQLRMIAAIAYMGGYDIRDDRVKTLCYACLCGNAAKDVLKGVGIQAGSKLTKQAIERLSFEVIKKINQAVGFRFLTKFGETGIINLGKTVPIVGGIVGGSFDGFTTRAIGRIARTTFIDKSNMERDTTIPPTAT